LIWIRTKTLGVRTLTEIIVLGPV